VHSVGDARVVPGKASGEREVYETSAGDLHGVYQIVDHVACNRIGYSVNGARHFTYVTQNFAADKEAFNFLTSSVKAHMPRKNVLSVSKFPRPRCLELFCGGGGSGHGLRLGGFKSIIGVDREDHRKSYEHLPGMLFWQANVLDLSPNFIKQFDFVWASPPCQAFSSMVFKSQKEQHLEKWQSQGRHINYIPAVRKMLEDSGVPFVIENVQGAKPHLQGDLLKLCGTMFGLQVFRHRFFEFGNGAVAPSNVPPCKHRNCSVGIMSKGVRPPQIEKYENRGLSKFKSGEAPPGFRAIEKRFESHGDRVDYIYEGVTDDIRQKIKAAYDRPYVRSIKEALRVLHELTPMTEEEKKAEQERYRKEMEKGLPKPGTKQMFPIYGRQMTRGRTEDWRDAMGMTHWDPTRDEIREAVPPAYGRFIASHVISTTLKPRPRRTSAQKHTEDPGDDKKHGDALAGAELLGEEEMRCESCEDAADAGPSGIGDAERDSL